LRNNACNPRICTSIPNMHNALGAAHGTSSPSRHPGGLDYQCGQHACVDDGVCSECSLMFPLRANNSSLSLTQHASRSKHKSFRCICGNSYNRKDVLKRHIIAADSAESDFHCHLCDRSFRRKDHLTQHLGGFHHGDFRAFDLLVENKGVPTFLSPVLCVCPHAGCPANRSEAWIAAQSTSGFDEWPFRFIDVFDLHMAHIHNEIAYTCPTDSCSLPKGKFFKYRKDFEEHCWIEHKVEVKAERREEFRPFCWQAGCRLRLVQGQYSWQLRCPNSVEDEKDQSGYIRWRHL